MTNPDDMPGEFLAGPLTRMLRKKKLRENLRRRMEVNRGDSENVVSKVLAYLGERPDLAIVAMYSALPGEVGLHSLLEGMERIWLFPKVEGEDMVFYQVKKSGKDLKVGAYGILEPRKGLPRYEPEDIDLFLCPGLGFDLEGGRIGRGKGFYDRLLSRARPGAVKLGVCFGYQIVHQREMAMEDHDIRMNGVIAG